MKHRYTPQPTETISLQVESSPVWEIILGIAAYTHAQLRHTFDLDEEWTMKQKAMPETLRKQLQEIQETNLWYGLIMVQNRLSADSVQQFSNHLIELPIADFYDTLLPYKNRDHEPMRKETVSQYEQKQVFEKYATYFEDHEFLGGYIQQLGNYAHKEIRSLFTNIVKEWYKWVGQQEEWEQWMQALAFEQKSQFTSLDKTKYIEEIERITGGVKYIPEPSVWTVKLIPHVSYRPWILEQRTPDTKLFFYPLKEEYLTKPGAPSNEIIRGHKALGDELRLKLLYQLFQGPLSLQEMSVQFSISKTTLHHQLSILKAAKFIRAEKGVYSANPAQINAFSKKLPQYLGVYQ